MGLGFSVIWGGGMVQVFRQVYDDDLHNKMKSEFHSTADPEIDTKMMMIHPLLYFSPAAAKRQCVNAIISELTCDTIALTRTLSFISVHLYRCKYN